MSILVSWTAITAGPLDRGWIPNGLASSDFEGGFDNEVNPGSIVARTKIDEVNIGDFGMSLYVMPAPVQRYRTRIRPGEVIALLKDPSSPNKGSYAKIFRAAYPHGAAPADDIALEFLEQAKFPYSEDGMIDVADIESALDYFLATPQNYIDQSDHDRVTQGWPID